MGQADRLRLRLESGDDVVALETGDLPRPCWTGQRPWDHAACAGCSPSEMVVEAPAVGYHYVFVVASSDADGLAEYRLASTLVPTPDGP